MNSMKDIDFGSLKDSYFQHNKGMSNEDRQATNEFTATSSTDQGQIFNETNSKSMVWGLVWNAYLNFTGVVGGGYNRVVEEFAKPILETVQLKSVVRSIDYSSSGTVKVTADDLSNNATRIYLANVVICTVPIGVLQNRDIKFHPNLPNRKWDAIDSIGNGGVNKCIMYWDKNTTDVSWWPYGQYELQFISDDDSHSGYWTYFTNDQYHKGNEEIHVLTAWSAGAEVEVLESEDDNKTMERVLFNLRNMFGSVVPEPTKLLVTRWNSDQFSRGVHTFSKVGVDEGKVHKELRKPVQNIYFAGEYIESGTSAVSAYRSGVNTASLVINSTYLNKRRPKWENNVFQFEKIQKVETMAQNVSNKNGT